MNKFLLAGLSLLILFPACKKLSDSQPEFETKDTLKTSSEKQVSTDNSGAGIFQGLYTVNINTSSFRDCESPDSVYWLVDSTRKLRSMYQKIFPEKNVYNTVVIKVKGELRPTEDIVLSDKFPKTLYVNEIIYVEKKNFTNTCVPYDFWGFGNKQDWSLQISKKENRIEFNLPSEKKTYFFFYSEPKEENGTIIYSNYNTIQRYVIEIFIKKERCTDDKGNVNNYSVQVNLTGDKRYNGCAIRGTEPE
jgi:uncharacterized membrane protein